MNTTTTTGIIPACEYCNGQPSAYWPKYSCRPACDTCIDCLLDEREADNRETQDDLNDYDRPKGWTTDEMASMDAHLDALVCTYCGLQPDLSERQWDRDDGPACRQCDGHGLTQRGEYESRSTDGDGPGGVQIQPQDYQPLLGVPAGPVPAEFQGGDLWLDIPEQRDGYNSGKPPVQKTYPTYDDTGEPCPFCNGDNCRGRCETCPDCNCVSCECDEQIPLLTTD